MHKLIVVLICMCQEHGSQKDEWVYGVRDLQKTSWCRSTLDLGLPREPCERDIKLKIHNCSVRAAISHLTLHRLIKAHIPVVLNALTGLPTNEAPVTSADDLADPANAFTTVTFRQTFSKVHVCIEEVSTWLCTDGSHSFGAPDVMQVCLSPCVPYRISIL